MLKYEEEERVNIYTTRDFRGHITSQLTIRRAKLSNSGNYTCFPTVAKPKIVIVNVVLQGTLGLYINICLQINNSYIR